MSLTSYFNDGLESLGLSGPAVKPITEGVKLPVNDEQTSGGVFGWLDGVGDSIGDTFSGLVGSAANIRADNYLNDLIGGPGETVDSTGESQDKPGNINRPENNIGFVEQYKMPLLIGGAAIGGLLLIMAMRK